MFNQDQIITGKYKINTKIGGGGMGVVYNATHTALHREEALKVLHEEYGKDPSFVERFFREARAMARLNHENIVRVFDVFNDKDKYFIAMEHFKGDSLTDFMQQNQRVSTREALHIVLQAAQALAYAHKKGIVHRDIKPGNILVNDKGQVKLVDFGIAAAIDDTTLTSTGQLVGSPRYMSPEQARGEVVTESSDLFSLGMVLYELITSTSPFEGDSGVVVIGKLAYQENEITLRFPDDINTSIVQLIQELLKRKPYERIQSADQLVKRLSTIMALEETATHSGDNTIRYKPAHARTARTLHTGKPERPPKPTTLKRLTVVTLSLLMASGIATYALYHFKLIPTEFIPFQIAQHSASESAGEDDQPHADDRQTNTQQTITPVTVDALQTELDTLQKIINTTKNQVIVAKSSADAYGARRYDNDTYASAARQYENGLAKFQAGQNSIAQQALDKAKSELLVAKTYLEDALNNFQQLRQNAEHNQNEAQNHSIALNNLDQSKNQALTAQQRADQSNSRLFAGKIYQTALQHYRRAKTAEKKATSLANNGDYINAALQLEKATHTYAKAASHFNRSQELAQSVDLNTQVNKSVAQLRKMQLSIIDATEKADQANAKQLAASQYRHALNLADTLTKESLVISQYINQQQHASALSSLQKALPLAEQTKQAFLHASRSANERDNTSTIIDPTSPRTADVNKPSASDIAAVEQLLFDFEKAYEAKNINQLKMLADMSSSRLTMVNKIFNQFENIDISISSYSVTGDSASAEISINHLTNLQGDTVTPANSWKNSEVYISKDQGRWKKIRWQ